MPGNKAAARWSTQPRRIDGTREQRVENRPRRAHVMERRGRRIELERAFRSAILKNLPEGCQERAQGYAVRGERATSDRTGKKPEARGGFRPRKHQIAKD